MYAFISLLNICVLVSLMYGRFPWYYSNWNCTRRQGNQLLINSGIRALTPDKQLEYMNDKQINDISRYYRQFNLLHPLIKAKNWFKPFNVIIKLLVSYWLIVLDINKTLMLSFFSLLNFMPKHNFSSIYIVILDDIVV